MRMEINTLKGRYMWGHSEGSTGGGGGARDTGRKCLRPGRSRTYHLALHSKGLEQEEQEERAKPRASRRKEMTTPQRRKRNAGWRIERRTMKPEADLL